MTAETVARDRGRCSIIVWDLGNESRWGRGFDAQLALVRSMDPSRPTTFSFDLNEMGAENELVGKPAAERPDIRSYHYPGWDRTWQEDLDWLNSYDQPVVLDEYAPAVRPVPPRARARATASRSTRASAITGGPATSRSWRRRSGTAAASAD